MKKTFQVAVRISEPAYRKLGVLRRRLGMSATRVIESSVLEYDVENKAVQAMRECHEENLQKAA